MTDAALAFLGGLGGSSHCVGMCGAFVLAVGAGAKSWRANLGRQLAFAAGRIFTYACAGAFAGYGGAALAGRTPATWRVQAWLSIAAGMILAWQGLKAAGWLRLKWKRRGATICPTSSALRVFLGQGDARSLFLAGTINGFVPCGLVYAYVALAASTNDLGAGLVLMAAFGAGTMPLLVAIGVGGALLTLGARKRLTAIAACCAIAAGAVAIGRGAVALAQPAGAPPTCPACDR